MLLTFQQLKKLFSEFNIPFLEGEVVSSLKEALLFARKNGFPLVLKIDSPRVVHKTEKGLVKFCYGIEDIQKSFKKLKRFGGNILIQKMGDGRELILGAKRDKVFGEIALVGMGGIFAEVFGDVSFGFSPLSKKRAVAMIKSLKFFKVLKGYRGLERVDVAKLAEVLVNLSKMMAKRPDIDSIDLNPVFVKGSKIHIVDAKVFVKTKST